MSLNRRNTKLVDGGVVKYSDFTLCQHQVNAPFLLKNNEIDKTFFMLKNSDTSQISILYIVHTSSKHNNHCLIHFNHFHPPQCYPSGNIP